jgi:subtilisin family serine protease
MDGKAKRASFSNYGKTTVHVVAPGVKIYSTGQGNKYKKMSGTSMDCPFVAGVAGLIMASEPNLTYKDVKKRMMINAREGNKLRDFSVSGFVDSFQSLQNRF